MAHPKHRDSPCSCKALRAGPVLAPDPSGAWDLPPSLKRPVPVRLSVRGLIGLLAAHISVRTAVPGVCLPKLSFVFCEPFWVLSVSNPTLAHPTLTYSCTDEWRVARV